MAEYSAFSILKNALSGNRDWKPAWRKPEPKPSYDVIIVGGGGHGLSTAYYLAKEHGITNVAVVEKGWLGSGNIGRNTTIVRSNYLLPENIRLLRALDEALGEPVPRPQLQRHVLAARRAQPRAHARAARRLRSGAATPCAIDGGDAEFLIADADRQALSRRSTCQLGALSRCVGGLLQPRAGTARHDAVAWGYARGADRRGVDIIENCEVTGFLRDGDRIVGVTTTRGEIRAKKVGVAVAGSTGQVMKLGRHRQAADREPRAAGLRVGER